MVPPKREVTKDDSEDSHTLETKKVKPCPIHGDLNSAKCKNGYPYQINITLHPKFVLFPDMLIDGLQRACGQTLYRREKALCCGIMPSTSQRQTYKLIKGQRVRSISPAFTHDVLLSNIPDLVVANIALLEHLLSEKQLDLRQRRRASFLHMPKRDGLKNPESLELYLARLEEVAWGEDSEGCFAFYFTQVEENKLREDVWYVMNGGIKVADET